MKPLRVVTIGHSYVVGLNCAVMARVARQSRVELTVVAPSFFHGDLRPLTLDRTAPVPYRLEPVNARLSKYIHIFYYENLAKVLAAGQFDLVHAWEEPYILGGFQIARAAQAAGARYFFRTAQNLSKWYPPPFSQFESFCTRQAVGWVAGGHLVKRTLQERGGYPEVAEVITLGVDEDDFHPDTAARDAVRRKLGLKGPVIGFVGRLTAAKGLDVLMAALDRVPGPWTLLALGSGPYESRLHAWATARGLGDRVRVLLATHEQVPNYLRAMDLLVAPSQTTRNWREQFGRMIVEAFATRLPVIGSDSGEIPYVLEGVGLVVTESDVQAWAEAISGLLQCPERRTELADAGLERFHRHYSAAHVADRYIEFYQRLMDVRTEAGRHRPIVSTS